MRGSCRCVGRSGTTSIAWRRSVKQRIDIVALLLVLGSSSLVAAQEPPPEGPAEQEPQTPAEPAAAEPAQAGSEQPQVAPSEAAVGAEVTGPTVEAAAEATPVAAASGKDQGEQMLV